MTSRDNRPTSAQSRMAWGTDMDSGYGRPDNQFEFGPRDDPDLPVAMENDIYMDRDKGKNEVAPTKPTENQGCFTKFRKGVRCKFRNSSYISNDQNNLTYYTIADLITIQQNGTREGQGRGLDWSMSDLYIDYNCIEIGIAIVHIGEYTLFYC